MIGVTRVAFKILAFGAAFIFAVPFAVLAILCFLSLIGVPFGFLLLGIGTAPLRFLINRWIMRPYIARSVALKSQGK